jgi:hypothetical protein
VQPERAAEWASGTSHAVDSPGVRLGWLSLFLMTDVLWFFCCCRNGTVRWVFKNASIYKIPGSFDYEDIHVNPQRMDIAAGNAVIHVMDTL